MASVNISHESGEVVKCSMKKVKPGLHICNFTPSKPGLYLVDIYVDDILLPG